MAVLLIRTFYFPSSKPSVCYSFVCLKSIVKHEVRNFFFLRLTNYSFCVGYIRVADNSAQCCLHLPLYRV